MAKQTEERPSLMEAIKAATNEDLATLRAREAELVNELESVRIAAKLVNTKLHGRQKRRSPARKEAAPASDGREADLARRIYDYVVGHGASAAAVIAQALAVSPQAVDVTCAKSDWFKQLEGGRWTIAKTGVKAAG